MIAPAGEGHLRPTAKTALVLGAFVAGLAVSWWLSGITPRPLRALPGDADGRREYRYRRIICMAPSVSEIAFSMGAGDRVVGVSQHTKFPPEALSLPKCGGFFNPSHEMILGLVPDLLITQGEAVDLTVFADDNGIDLVTLALIDLESIPVEIRRLGGVLQMEAEAEVLCAEMRLGLARVRARAARRPRPGVLLVIGRETGSLSDIYAVGGGTFLSDLVEAAGGRNVLADAGSDYGIVSKEAILERAPDVVIELHGEGMDAAAAESDVRALWAGLAPLPAVRSGRVHVVESTYAMIPGPRVVLLAERFAEILHGEGGR